MSSLARFYTSEVGTISVLLLFLRQLLKDDNFYSTRTASSVPRSLQSKNNMALALQRLVHNEKYAAVEHQGHCRMGFLKRAEKSSTERANKARWLMNSRNSLTNPIAGDKLKCQRAGRCGITLPMLFCDKSRCRASSKRLSAKQPETAMKTEVQ